MAWIYLAESEDSQKPWKDTSNQLPTVKTTDMLKPFSCLECHEANYQRHPFGMTCRHFEVRNFHLDPISFMEDSHARTFPSQDAAKVWKESEADYFLRSQGSLAKYDRDSSSWKTYQLSIFGEEMLSSELWPTSGMTVDGTCYQLRMWARITDENDGGSLLGDGRLWMTPKAGNCGMTAKTTGRPLKKSTHLQAQVHCWPTPQARSASDCESERRRHTPSLESQVKWPTPTVNMVSGGANHESPTVKAGRHGINLKGAVMKFPTPQARDWKDGKNPKPHGRHAESLPVVINQSDGGALNPTWVEWLMGYPSEWTVLEDWAIAWYRPKRGKHLKDSSALNK